MLATGAGKDSNIDIVGSDVSAKRQAALVADNAINLLSAQDLEEQHSRSKSMSAAAGVGISVGTNGAAFGATASGGDMNVKGAAASGKRIEANVGGDLNIESRQDTARFDSKSQNASVSATVGYGASVSASYNQSNISNDYASVQEQSGLKAGDGGFDVKVRGNTDLKGAVISSTQAAVDAGVNRLATGTFTHGDVRNHLESSADSIGVSGGIGVAGGDKDDPAKGAGKGPGGVNLTNAASATGAKANMPIATSTGDSRDSVTKSGVSGGAIVIANEPAQQQKTGKSAADTVAALNRDVATGKDGSAALKNDFDKEALQAQTTITAAFIQQTAPLAASIVGDIGKAQQDKAQREAQAYQQAAQTARNAGDAAGAAAYEEQARQAQATADNWSDNGVYRVGLHAAAQAAIGGAASGTGGALAGAGGVVGGNLGQQLGRNLEEQAAAAQGLEGKAKADLVNSYQQAFATLGGAVGGIAAGGAGGGNAVVAGVHGAGSGYAVDAFNRQLHPDERKWAQENARKYQQYLASKTGEAVTTEEAYQRLLSAGYAVVDDAAARGGKSDEIAKQYINANAPKSMFAATASERANPFLNGNADGSFMPEQQARFGSSKPGQQASAAVTRAMPYVGQPCSDCRSKVAALDDAVTKLQEARLLYQDDAGSVKLIDQQIDQLKAAITKDELARGMAGAISDKDKGIAALVLGTPSRVLAGAATSELLERTALTQAIKEVRAGLASDVKKGGNVAVAQIDIPGLPSQMAASSKVDNAGRGVVGDGSGNFAATELPLKNGDLVKRNTDSEYKILDNIADLLGDNTELRGRVKIVTERPACDSCLNVVEQFRAKYPNIEVKVFDNNGVPLPPRNTPTGGG